MHHRFGVIAHGLWSSELDSAALGAHDQVMSDSFYGRRLSRASLTCAAVMCALGVTACSSAQSAATDNSPAQSGQTGSPNAEPPDYVTPGPREPSGGSNGGETGAGGFTPTLIPKPAPAPSPGQGLLEDVLLVPTLDGLSVFDVGDPTAPEQVASLDVPGPTLAYVHDAERVGFTSYVETTVSSETIPGPIPYGQRVLFEADVSNASSPHITRELALPEETGVIIRTETGLTLVGGEQHVDEPACGGSLGEIGFLPQVTGMWLRQYTEADDTFTQTNEVNLGAGYWTLSEDERFAARVELEAFEPPAGPFALQVFDLQSLDMVLELDLAPEDLGQPWGGVVELESSDDVLAISGGPRVLFWDRTTFEQLPSVELSSAVEDMRFLDEGRLLSLGGPTSPLFAVDSSGTVPTIAPVDGVSPAAQLEAFGDEFVALSSSPSETLLVSRYALVDGELTSLDELDTGWHYRAEWRNAVPAWEVDTAHSRVTYSLPVDDTDHGRLGVIELVDGALAASELEQIDRVSPRPVGFADSLLAVSSTRLQSLTIDRDGAAPELDAAPAAHIAVDDVWRQTEHAGLLWTVHRTDTGLWSFSARTDSTSAPQWFELPHLVGDVRTLDDTHVVALGLQANSDCEPVDGAEPIPECDPNQGLTIEHMLPTINGLSVLRVEDGVASVVESFTLSSRMGPSPPEGIRQSTNWLNVVELSENRLAVIGRMQQECNSVASCERLGVTPHTSFGSSGSGPCTSEDDCNSEPVIQEFISGYHRETWLVPFDLSDTEAPVQQETARGGLAFFNHGPVDMGHPLMKTQIGEVTVWGYRSVEEIYGPDGNSVYDENERPIARHYLQTFRDNDGQLSFDEPVQVPGLVVGLTDPRDTEHLDAPELTAFSLQAEFQSAEEQTWILHRLSVGEGEAWIEESVPVAEFVGGAQANGNLLGILTAPDDWCADDARFSVVAVDMGDDSLDLSTPLELDSPQDWGWGFSAYTPTVDEPGIITLGGGPARGRGRLLVDVTTDPPSIVRYETFEQYDAFDW